ncbi:MAG: tyrosine--tRNA ligase, partial [Candidatus Lokiarchaeota archaeon]|nr:tyrosine--tRNA ligase [Candidatus Lokiarchaeota archaeon]
LEYCKYIIFELSDYLKIERPEKYGGNVEYSSFKELEKAFGEGKLNPADLKPAVIKYLNQFLAPVIDHFEKDEKARKLYEFVKAENMKYKGKVK